MFETINTCLADNHVAIDTNTFMIMMGVIFSSIGVVTFSLAGKINRFFAGA